MRSDRSIDLEYRFAEYKYEYENCLESFLGAESLGDFRYGVGDFRDGLGDRPHGLGEFRDGFAALARPRRPGYALDRETMFGSHCPPATARCFARPPGLMSIIEVRDLTKSYRVYKKSEGLRHSLKGLFHRQYEDVHAVKGIDLDVEQGEFVAFLGPNGAGKTTTLKLLSGVINPTSGSATVMGHVPWQRNNDYRRRFALVMGQKNQLWWDLPAAESYRLNQQIYGVPKPQFDATMAELTELLDVGRLLNQPVRELSLGERMKMELIAALLHSPDVLFLDEPTIGLDVIAQHNIQQFLRYYQQKRKITILLTSHYMKDIAALCKRVVVIAGGRIEYDGSLSGIIDRFSNHKIVSLQFQETGQSFADRPDMQRYGEIVDDTWPKIRLKVDRGDVPRLLSEVLADHPVEDIGVEEVPLEDVIAELFRESSSRKAS